MSADMLDPTAPTWKRGIDLKPVTPRLIASIANVYRQFVFTAQTPDERAYYIAQVEKWAGASSTEVQP